MGGSGSKAQQAATPAPQQQGVSNSNVSVGSPELYAAQQELEALTDMYTRMMDQCFKKCVNNYNESDLGKGESTCVERCVYKYLEVHQKIGTRLQNFTGQQH